MKVKIQFFGRYKEITGKSELSLTVTTGNTIWHAVEQLAQQFPEIEKDKRFIMVAKNNVYTSVDELIQEGDVIIISPPIVSGG